MNVRFEGKKKMMVLEVSQRRIQIIEYIPGTMPLKVTRFASVDRPEGEPSEVAKFLRRFLDEQGVTAKKAKVVFTATSVEHRVITLPRVSREERQLLVMRKLEEELRIPISELSISSRVVGKKVERGSDKDEVMAVSTPIFEIKRLMFTLIEAEIEPLIVTTLPVACAMLHQEGGKDDYIAHVLISREKSFVTISENGFPRFSREIHVGVPELDLQGSVGEIQISGSPGEVEEVNPVGKRLVTELTRSFLYYKQLSRGGTVKRMYLMGEGLDDSLISYVQGKMAIEIYMSDSFLEGKIDFIGGPHEGSADFALNQVSHLLLIALNQDDKDEINLLPPEYLGRKRKLFDMAAIAVVSTIFVLVNALLIVGILSAKAHYRNILSELEGQYLHLDQNREYAMKIYNLKEKARISEEILKNVEHPFKSWETYFGLMSMGTPASVTYNEMSISKGGGSYEVTLLGTVGAMHPEKVQSVFNDFYASFEGNPFIEKLRYEPLSIYPVEVYRHKYEEQFVLNLQLIKEAAR